MNDNDGGPAFPSVMTHWNQATIDHGPGMSLRDWFAGQALVALTEVCVNGDITPDGCAHDAYQIADAMLKVRNRKEASDE